MTFYSLCVFQVGVKHLVVFINKADMVEDPELLELVSLGSYFDKPFCSVMYMQDD